MGSVSITLKDGQLRTSAQSQPNQEVIVIGHATSGTVAEPQRFTSIDALTSEFGYGEGVEVAAHLISKCGVVRFCRATATAITAPTLVLTGTSPAITCTGNPHDNYEILITVKTGGALGTATLSFSFDNGSTTEYGDITTAASITSYATSTGIIFACASGTFVAGDTYAVTCGRPVISGANYVTALDAAVAMSGPFRSIICVGIASSLANQLTAMGTVQTAIEGYFTAGTHCTRAFFECTSDTDATVSAAISAINRPRCVLVLGHAYVQSVITGRQIKRSQAFPIVSRLARSPNAERAGRVRSGPIDDPIASITRDDRVTPNAKSMRCAALMTREFGGVSAVYSGPVRTLALGNSDFADYTRAAVADEASRLFFEFAAYWLEEKLELTSESSPGAGDSGRLTDDQADVISSDITGRLRSAMRPLVNGKAGPDASVTDVVCTVSTSNDVSSTEQLLGSISLVPFGYSESITFDVGFTL